MASWDDEEFEPGNVATEPVVTDKWEGEDEDDDDLKDNWDDDDEEENKNAENKTVTVKKKKKPIEERIREKQELRRKELLAKEEEMRKYEEENKALTPEEEAAEKLRVQKLQEESDLELAKDAFGITSPMPGCNLIDSFEPSSKEDFTELGNMIVQKLTKYENNHEYSSFLEVMFRDLCAGVDAEEIKRISNTLNILATEKLKIAKAATKGKKKAPSKKNTLTAGKGTRSNEMDYNDDYYNEYEDFM